MLERFTNQAAGLSALAQPQGPRLMAMVNHGDEALELPLLWRLCSAMMDYGYAVTILDATTCESQANPGLAQLLEYDAWHSSANADSAEWKIIPAAFGLQNLGLMPERKAQSLHLLGQLFQHEGVLIIYGKAQWLVPLLSNSGIKPLLAVAPIKSSLLGSYVALKHLLLNGRLAPTIVNLVQSTPAKSKVKVRAVATTLSECAKNFLGYEVNALTISASFDDGGPCADMQNLALRMLEDAILLEQHASAPPLPCDPAGAAHFTGSH
jgi:hypothetical protein